MEKINDLSKTIKIELRNVKVSRWVTSSLYKGILYINGWKIGEYEVEAHTRKEAIKEIIRNIHSLQYITNQKNLYIKNKKKEV